MITHGVLIKMPTDSDRICVCSPLGVVVKKSDIARAQILVSVKVDDQWTMNEANRKLLIINQSKIKARITTDFTASGINRASYSPAFQYPSLLDGIQMLFRGCYMGKTDITRYFHSFPLASESRWLCEVRFQGHAYQYGRCPFGYTTCPYYCSTWSAEFKLWLANRGIETAHLMDDWLVVDHSYPTLLNKLEVVHHFFADIGLVINTAKDESGQVLTFLGVLLDSVNMTMRFDPVQSKAMRLELTVSLRRLSGGLHLDHTTVRHICGKLNWYSEVLQSGRIHLRSWWMYERHLSHLLPTTFNRLLIDTQWWIDILLSWESEHSSGIEYPIVSASELMANPESIMIVQSDASGTDGFGYYYSYYRSPHLSWVSKRWLPDRVAVSSHTDELFALADFLAFNCAARDAILVWVTDSESAMWSINKGRCVEPAGDELLVRILSCCDRFHLQIVALWVPRELNELADYLSHFAFNVDRDQIGGIWAHSDQHPSAGGDARWR
jgi:hypothetical protein